MKWTSPVFTPLERRRSRPPATWNDFRLENRANDFLVAVGLRDRKPVARSFGCRLGALRETRRDAFPGLKISQYTKYNNIITSDDPAAKKPERSSTKVVSPPGSMTRTSPSAAERRRSRGDSVKAWARSKGRSRRSRGDRPATRRTDHAAERRGGSRLDRSLRFAQFAPHNQAAPKNGMPFRTLSKRKIARGLHIGWPPRFPLLQNRRRGEQEQSRRSRLMDNHKGDYQRDETSAQFVEPVEAYSPAAAILEGQETIRR